MNKILPVAEAIPEPIVRFLNAQTCATICCINEGMPWCFSCFYAFDPVHQLFYYKSSADTKHAALLLSNGQIAGTVLPDKLKKVSVQGIQFQGRVLPIEDPAAQAASSFYHKTHPMALAIPGQVWTVQVDFIKMTDSTLGFGKKNIWKRLY